MCGELWAHARFEADQDKFEMTWSHDNVLRRLLLSELLLAPIAFEFVQCFVKKYAIYEQYCRDHLLVASRTVVELDELCTMLGIGRTNKRLDAFD